MAKKLVGFLCPDCLKIYNKIYAYMTITTTFLEEVTKEGILNEEEIETNGSWTVEFNNEHYVEDYTPKELAVYIDEEKKEIECQIFSELDSVEIGYVLNRYGFTDYKVVDEMVEE